MNVDRYLERLELPPKSDTSLRRLKVLHERHLLAVPFENLDVVRGVAIKLDVDAFFDKVVVRRRGGFCFELNGLFGALLEELGYPVTRIAARVHGPDGTPGLEFGHMALLVEAEGRRYLADVGFGDAFIHPLPLEIGGSWTQLSGRYRLSEGEDGVVYEAVDRDTGEFRPTYSFADTPRRLEDFAEGCAFHQSSPESMFTKGPVCTKAIPDGRVTLTREKLVVTRRGRRDETAIDGDVAFTEALNRHFGVVL